MKRLKEWQIFNRSGMSYGEEVARTPDCSIRVFRDNDGYCAWLQNENHGYGYQKTLAALTEALKKKLGSVPVWNYF
jgi:uncharacterized C2H2 Zn-finger protein